MAAPTRSVLCWLATALALASALVPPAAGTTNVTVHVRIDASLTFPFAEPAFVSECDVTVPEGANGSVVLNVACITDWAFVEFPCCGRFVTSITGPELSDPTDQRNLDDPCPGFVGYWSFWINGALAATGIDGYTAQDGDLFEMDYAVDEGCTFALSLLAFFTNLDPDSPVPVSGVL